MATRYVFIILLFLVLFSCGKKKTITVLPRVAPITEAVFAPGYIEAGNEVVVAAINEGYLAQSLIAVGDEVRKGEILFKQDDASWSVQQKTASENFEIAARNASANSPVLKQLQSELDAATKKMQADNLQLERLQRLYATNTVSKLDLENAQLAYNNSLSHVTGIKNNIEATRLGLQQTLINSHSQTQTAALNKAYAVIRSPGNYKVYSVLKKEGELVKKGEALAILGEPGNSIVVLNIDESSVDKIQLGQLVLIELNTEKQKIYTARISKIDPAFNEQTGWYRAEARFDSMPKDILKGTQLQANIIVARKDKAFLIPRNSLTPHGKVVVHSGNRHDTITIKTGIISSDWVEVVEGLSPNQKIIQQ